MNIKITGGISGPDSVSIQSDRYLSTATYSRDGKIFSEAVPLTRAHKWIESLPTWYVPDILRFFLFVLVNAERRVKVVIITLQLIQIGLAVSIAFDTTRPRLSLFWEILYPNLVAFMLVGMMLYIVRLTSIAGLHAAEHQAIAAYNLTGQTDIASIRASNRIDPHCGGRFALPMYLIFSLGSVVQSLTTVPSLLVALVGCELVFRLDRWIGLDRIPLLSHASIFIQRHFTTRPPSELELQTAQAAIESLLALHERDQTHR